MKFVNIYKESEEKVRSMLLTFWTPGYHPMRPHVDELLRREPLMAEPVFQSIFPWRNDDTGGWNGALSKGVVTKLEIGRHFNPRLNQSESWRAAHDGNSIVVTSGTGSGKTECFMFPVLDYVYNHRRDGGIQAIFLYPLNALMEDQRERLDEYCKKLDLTYAVYNGSTPESNNGSISEDEVDGTAVEIRNRIDIREKCPHILLTNPSMLEYVLVRNKDQKMLESSKGKLKWIVIDEAHTFSGSSALELKWQIKRTLDAFGVTADEVQFACTSATIGDKQSEQKLRKFISTLTGQDESRIRIIGGERVVPQLTKEEISEALRKNDVNLDVDKVIELRRLINEKEGMSLTEMIRMLTGKKNFNRLEALVLIDTLCEIEINGKALLALRAHFNMRNINGIYACGNPDCADANHPRFGHITSRMKPKCSCGANMLELCQCARCKTFVLTGKEERHSHELRRYSGYGDDNGYFSLSEEDDFEQTETIENEGSGNDLLYLAPASSDYSSPSAEGGELRLSLAFNGNGTIVTEDNPHNDQSWVALIRDGKRYCTECAENLSTKRIGLFRFQATVNLLNANLAPVFLNECSAIQGEWGKYLAFTDSRQGTAKSAKGFNIEVERNISRKNAYNALRERYTHPAVDPSDQIAIDAINALTDNIMGPVQKEQAIHNLLAGKSPETTLSLKELAKSIFDKHLFDHIKSETGDEDAYRKAILRQFLQGRAVRGQNAESLGVMTVLYSGLTNINVPTELDGKCTKEEWHAFLKIILDYLFRSGNHVQPLEQGEKEFLRGNSFPTPVAPPSMSETTGTRWPRVVNGTLRQSKYVRLICAALGIHTLDALTSNTKKIDNILVTAFNDLVKAGLLKVVTKAQIGYNIYGTDEHVGKYYLNLCQDETKVKVKICDKAWLCPVSQTFTDTVFMGYSPTMGNGDITLEAMGRYRIADLTETYDNSTLAKNVLGPVWSNFHDNITDTHQQVYLAAEHSGQQDRNLLKEYTRYFKETPPALNVLQCSTTMEMGVDIGDIDFVLLTTVPPTAANYMQRVGRAGRSGQTKAAAFSFCNDTPTGTAAFNNPMWAIKTVSAISEVVESHTILQRHVNAFLFREYLIRDNGMSLAMTIGDFIECHIDPFISWLDDMITDQAMQQKFHRVFGADIPYTAERTGILTRKLLSEYQKIHKELDDALVNHNGTERRSWAIKSQMEKLESDNLLVYLSNAQFLPNANMPTGVMDFKLNDEGHDRSISAMRKKKKYLKRKVREAATQAEKERARLELNSLLHKEQALLSSEIISREGKLGLSEYAPQQTVVVDERNYPSAGILMRGEYGSNSREKFLYFCRHCGNIEYSMTMDENRSCSKCNHPYCGILDDRSQSLTRVYEPAGFSADINEGVSRKEMNYTNFYDIRPVLLNYEELTEGIHMLMVSPSKEYGSEILFCNAGSGKGFAICTKCGRAVIEDDMGRSLPDRMADHKKLDRRYACDASVNDIKRNVVLSARHQTCYVVMAFKNTDGYGLVHDEETVLSLGVIITRALARVLGIDSTEVDFGVREEKDRWLLFIYDTAKGGCGYSLYLKDLVTQQQVLSEALRILSDESQCFCEKTGGACPECLSSRETFLFDSKLSKKKALDWLRAQAMSQTPVPTEVSSIYPSARYNLETIAQTLDKAVHDSATTGITLVLSDYPDAPRFAEAFEASTPLGRTVLLARQRNLPIRVLVEFHPELYSSELDLMPFRNLGNLVPGGDVILVKDFGSWKPLAMVQTGVYAREYVTGDIDALEISAMWGYTDRPVYASENEIIFKEIDLPDVNSVPSDILLQGTTQSHRATSESYFKSVIAPAVAIDDSQLQAIKDAFRDKSVKITFSDPYLISPLSMIMAVGLAKEVCGLVGCRPIALKVSNNGADSRFGCQPLNDYSRVTMNFANTDEADYFMDSLCDDMIGLQPDYIQDSTAHFRYLRLETADGATLEIRPDHGFSGGWKSAVLMKDILPGRPVEFMRSSRQETDMLYYLLFTRNA